jgi:hydroxyacylglutathione hydrolase
MYLVIDDASQEAAVVDPYDASKISEGAKEQGVKVYQQLSTRTSS